MAQVIDFTSRAVAKPAVGFQCFEPSTKDEKHLFFVFRDPENYLILRYADLESIGPVAGISANSAVLLRFGGTMPKKVRIDGTRLMEMVRHLRWHRLGYIEESPDDGVWGEGTEVRVTRISVKEAKR